MSANYWLPSCRAFTITEPSTDPLENAKIYICVGQVVALSQYSCRPATASYLQLTTVVVRWLDQHPQRWNENFNSLVLLALQEAWPCK